MHTAKTLALPARPLPRRPVLGWASLRRAPRRRLADIESLPHRLVLTSGRAAIYQALRQLDPAPQSIVLVPSYHCPTMVAPALLLGLQPRFYGVGHDGLPLLQTIEAEAARRAVAIIVPHYFGLPRPLQDRKSVV